MHKLRIISALLLISVQTLQLSAQDDLGAWVSAGLEKGISKGTDIELEAQYRFADMFQTTDRWNASVSLSKRIYRNKSKSFNIKGAISYKFIKVYFPSSTKNKSEYDLIADDLDQQYYIDNGYDFNYTRSYTEDRHRLSAALSAGIEVGRLKISLRECYQYTFSDSVPATTKYRFEMVYDEELEDDVTVMTTSQGNKGGMNKQILRSRLGISYNIPHWKYDPFITYELFNDLKDCFSVEKSRITAGVDFSFAKKHDFKVAYIWQNRKDDDSAICSAISIGYSYSF